MTISRLEHISPIGVAQMGKLADRLADPEVPRLENVDTNSRPPRSAVEFTKQALDDDAANSYLPFFGLESSRRTTVAHVGRQSEQEYDWESECVISAGGLSRLLLQRNDLVSGLTNVLLPSMIEVTTIAIIGTLRWECFPISSSSVKSISTMSFRCT